MPLVVANRVHLERTWPELRFAQLELPAERDATLPEFSLVLRDPAGISRGIVELRLQEPPRGFSQAAT
jgi:hypothetical protein